MDPLAQHLVDKIEDALSHIGTDTPTAHIEFSAFELDLLLKIVKVAAAIRELTER